MSKLAEALRELIACKDLKAQIGANNTDAEDDYVRRKPLAWEAARAALAEHDAAPQPDVFGLPFAEAKARILAMSLDDARSLAVTLMIRGGLFEKYAAPQPVAHVDDGEPNRILLIHSLNDRPKDGAALYLAPQAAQPVAQWPVKPLKEVQVTLPSGASAMLKPERAYFDSWAMNELEKKYAAAAVAAERERTVREVMPLIDRYWELAFVEGVEGRTHDTEAGDAGETRFAIERALRGETT
jgi:hypothetical protein